MTRMDTIRTRACPRLDLVLLCGYFESADLRAPQVQRPWGVSKRAVASASHDRDAVISAIASTRHRRGPARAAHHVRNRRARDRARHSAKENGTQSDRSVANICAICSHERPAAVHDDGLGVHHHPGPVPDLRTSLQHPPKGMLGREANEEWIADARQHELHVDAAATGRTSGGAKTG